MSAVQIRDILNSLRNFYVQLAERFAAEEENVNDEQLPYLLEYIADHEEQLAAGIEKFKQSADARLLNTWLQFGAGESLEQILKQVDLHEGMSKYDVLAKALRADGQLIVLYEALAGDSSVPQVQELFESLASMQEARERQLARAIR